jgi:alpha-ketoglutaric semialdehyde dehydrogenase
MTVPTVASYVGGSWNSPSNAVVVPDTNPAHPREVVAQARHADTALVAAAVDAAADALADWRATPALARGDILRRAADLLTERAERIGHDLAREEGKTLAEAVGETMRAAVTVRYYAGLTLDPDGETYPTSEREALLYARREPVGVVGVITPWNFPILIPAWKIAPALAYANTVVWKPAELVPLTAVHLTEAFVDAGLPSGVLNLVLGRGSVVGDALTSSPSISAVTFTGSNAVGRALERKVVEQGKKIQLELGGKNAAVVLADADLHFAVEQVARGAFLSAGQKCTATSRVIVEDAAVADFTEALVATARAWPVGDPLAPTTRIGPLVSAEQLETVSSYVNLAKSEGAAVLTGGGKPAEPAEGHYHEPTVLSNLPLQSRVLGEEIFGPVVAIIPARSFEAAVDGADAPGFGLTATLVTADLEKALPRRSSVSRHRSSRQTSRMRCGSRTEAGLGSSRSTKRPRVSSRTCRSEE